MHSCQALILSRKCLARRTFRRSLLLARRKEQLHWVDHRSIRAISLHSASQMLCFIALEALMTTLCSEVVRFQTVSTRDQSSMAQMEESPVLSHQVINLTWRCSRTGSTLAIRSLWWALSLKCTLSRGFLPCLWWSMDELAASLISIRWATLITRQSSCKATEILEALQAAHTATSCKSSRLLSVNLFSWISSKILVCISSKLSALTYIIFVLAADNSSITGFGVSSAYTVNEGISSERGGTANVRPGGIRRGSEADQLTGIGLGSKQIK